MARIRSIHPSLFTDDAYMALSLAARELVKGLWCEADDNGIFVWKPLTIKARIFPADNIDVSQVLAELVGGGFIKSFTVGGRLFGAIRNFLRFQRPRRPAAQYPLPDQATDYLGSKPTPFPTLSAQPDDETVVVTPMSAKSPQMEDGGGSKEEEALAERSETEARAPSAPASEYAFEGEIIRLKPRDFAVWQQTFRSYPDLAAELRAIDARLVEQRHEGKWFAKVSGWLRTGHEARMRSAAPPISDADQEVMVWRSVLSAWQSGGRKRGAWPENRGVPPGVPGCRVPENLLVEFGMPEAVG